ncbi:MAG: sensor histidine kinase [Polyangiales bacterium]
MSKLAPHVSALPGLSLPERLIARLQTLALAPVLATPADIALDDPLAFPLIWVDDEWARGLSQLAELSAPVRERAVLIGERPPGHLGPRVRQLGALTYAHAEFPAWLIQPLAAALRRLAANSGTISYTPPRDPGAARDIERLLAVGDIAARVLDADAITLLVREQPGAVLRRLEPGANGLQLSADEAPGEIATLFDAAVRFNEVVTFPSLAHAPSLRPAAPVHEAPPPPPAHESALAVLLTSQPGLQCVLVATWHTPHLVHARELASLDTLCFIARAAWGHASAVVRARLLPPTAATVVTLASARSSAEADDRLSFVLRHVAELLGVPGVLLVLRDHEEAPERLHYAGEWFQPEQPQRSTAYRALHTTCPSDPGDWTAAIRGALERLGAEQRVQELLLLPAAADGRPEGALALVQKRYGSAGPREDLQRLLSFAAAHELLHAAWLTLETNERSRAEGTCDLLAASDGELFAVEPTLIEAARLIREATRADQVFVQFGRERASHPRLDDAARIGVGQRSVTRLAKRQGKCIRVLDAADLDRQTPREIDRHALDKLLASLGWRQLRSAILCPFADGRGLIKVYTREHGAYLTASDARLVHALANRLAQIVGHAQRGQSLHELNQLASEVAGLTGSQLTAALVIGLERWSAQFIRSQCQFLLAVRDAEGVTVLEGASDELPAGARAQLTLGQPHGHSLRAPLALQKAHGLTGELSLWHAQALPRHSADYLVEAARAISIVVYAEHLRHELRAQSGILRHGVLGPLQGLASHAKLLQRSFDRSAPLSPALQEGVFGILGEVRSLIQWRDRHRLLASFQWDGRVDVRPSRGELRPLVERCIDRFKEDMNERDLTLHKHLPTGGVQVDFDAYALDVALSNLLDNAVKYAFFNREISVGLKMRRGFVDIWVEDIGHGIPADRAELIYAPGARVGQRDPLRVIHGEGLGLYLARSIARAHDGELTHTTRPEGREGSDKTPHRVRFTLTIAGS